MKRSDSTTVNIPAALTAPLLVWYRENARDLPWRHTEDPYRIWVSEIMLQQTRVAAVLGYYARFLEAFPTVDALAAADEERLMKLWEGLGYYSRARNLQKAAQERGVALGKIYVMDKGYRTALFEAQMTHGRSIQTIKLPTVIKAAPHDYVNKIYEM